MGMTGIDVNGSSEPQWVDSDAKCNTCNLLVQRRIFDLAPKTMADGPGFESLPASSGLEPPSIAAL
jgi:hypothetical protein